MEQSEDAHHAENAEDCRAGREKDGQVIGEEGKQVNDTGQGKNIFPHRTETGQLWEKLGSCPQAEGIIHCKKGHRDGFYRHEKAAILQCHAVEGVKDGSRKICQQHQAAENVVTTTDPVLGRAHLDDGGGSFSASKQQCVPELHRDPPIKASDTVIIAKNLKIKSRK